MKREGRGGGENTDNLMLRTIIVNDEMTEVDVAPHWTLLRMIREELGLPGTKEG